MPAENRQTQTKFECVECGFEENADVVGAINVLRAGHARLACEVSGAVMPPAAGTHRSDLCQPDAGMSAVGIPPTLGGGGCQEELESDDADSALEQYRQTGAWLVSSGKVKVTAYSANGGIAVLCPFNCLRRGVLLHVVTLLV